MAKRGFNFICIYLFRTEKSKCQTLTIKEYCFRDKKIQMLNIVVNQPNWLNFQVQQWINVRGIIHLSPFSGDYKLLSIKEKPLVFMSQVLNNQDHKKKFNLFEYESDSMCLQDF